MKIIHFTDSAGPRLGLVKGDALLDLGKRLQEFPRTLVDLMGAWNKWLPALRDLEGQEADIRIAAVKVLPPIERPGKIMGIGLNYADHAAEAKMDLPQDQLWFTKAVTAVNGPFDPIELPKVSSLLDYEAELVFVIGKRCRHISKEEAKSVIFGYCVGNDVSVRDWQLKTSQFNLGKSFDTHAPFGPWVTTSDEIDPHHLNIQCFVNGDLRQNSNTKNLIFNCYDQVAHLSQAMTLEPGDIFFTGTPGGVGAGANPPQWLQRGDVVRVEIDGLGAIENKVVAE